MSDLTNTNKEVSISNSKKKNKELEETKKNKRTKERTSGPYINTELTSTVNIHPRQMDNNIYKNLKENLVNKLEGRCYSKYGYISKIFKILDYTKGRIIPENPIASALFGVKFSCKLCHPIKKRIIVCKIQKITKLFINASNGPITIIITMDRLNNKSFFFDQKVNKLFHKVEDTTKEIIPGSYVKVLIENLTFNDMDKIIMAIGNLQNIATNEEIKKSFDEEYGTDDGTIVDFEKYIKNEEDAEILQEETEENIKDKKENIDGTLKKDKEPDTTS
jgi:DNA-directed RNA polymerase subunit E'/Rpb7